MKRSVEIVPAILETDFRRIESKMKSVYSLASLVQIDITDGNFVPSVTYGSSGRSASMKRLREAARKYGLKVEYDLMVDLDCGNCMDRWVEALYVLRPARVIFHLGSTYRWDTLFALLSERFKTEDLPFECGLAVRVSHTRQEISKAFDEYPFDYIQVMGIEKVGYSGEKLSPALNDRITKLRRKYSDIPISVDGGVKEEHVTSLLEAGATRLGMNSGLFKTKDIKNKWQTLQDLI